MPRERDTLQSLPMALPAVIPHDSVLPDALSKPYTPPKPTVEAAPEPKPEEIPSFEAIYANLRQHATPTTDGLTSVDVVVDRMSVPYLSGATIDFADTIEKQGFTIDNPNAAGTCACGESFH